MLEMHFSVSFRYILPLQPYPEEKKHKLKWNSECTALFHVFLFRNVDMHVYCSWWFVRLYRFYCKLIYVYRLLLPEKPLKEVCFKFFRENNRWLETRESIFMAFASYSTRKRTRKLLMLNKYGDHLKPSSVQIFTHVLTLTFSVAKSCNFVTVEQFCCLQITGLVGDLNNTSFPWKIFLNSFANFVIFWLTNRRNMKSFHLCVYLIFPVASFATNTGYKVQLRTENTFLWRW